MLSLKPDLTVWCDGEPLESQVSWGDLNYAHAWPKGCYTASWRVTRPSQQRPRIIRHNVAVTITWGGWPIWAGTLDQPEWNGREAQLKAMGVYKLGEDNYKAFAAGGVTTDNPTTAITVAQGRGLPWVIGTGIPNTALVGGTTEPVNSIGALLDAWADNNGHRWAVDGRRRAYMQADPTRPYYQVPAGVTDLGQSALGYKSRIVLRYKHTSGTYKTVWWPGVTMPTSTADYTANERLWSFSEWTKDVTEELGPISDASAAALAEKLYVLGGQGNPGWTNGVTVPYGQLLNLGGRPVHPASVEAGRMVRLHGVPNELSGVNYTDFVIGETSYRHGDKAIGLNPVGIVSSSPEAAWTDLFEAG